MPLCLQNQRQIPDCSKLWQRLDATATEILDLFPQAFVDNHDSNYLNLGALLKEPANPLTSRVFDDRSKKLIRTDLLKSDLTEILAVD